LRAEEQTPVRQQCVVQGLDAEAVAREEEGLAPAVPQCKSEHSPEPLDAVCAPLFPGVDDHFGIADAAEAMTEVAQFLRERLEVINFPIVDDSHATVLVVHR